MTPRPGTTTERGYGPDHRQLRATWAPRVARGTVRCWRCGEPIHRGEPWDLGHDDHNRHRYRGPEHATCNRSAGGRQRGRTPTDTTHEPPGDLRDEPLEADEW